MGGFQVLDYLADLKDYANSSPLREVCGVVSNNKFIPITNISEDSNNFILDPRQYLNIEGITHICHSHLGLSAKPSAADIYSCNKGSVPWIIYAVESGVFEIVYPTAIESPFIGREYIFGIMDCWALIQDVYRIELGLKIGRPLLTSDEWFKEDINYFEMYAEENGFIKVLNNSLNKYDVLLFKAGNSNIPNHSGVLYNNDTFLHHLANRLSTQEIFGGYWNKCTVAVYRHKELF